MDASVAPPLESKLARMAAGYQVTQALFVAARLGIADLLAGEPPIVAALARAAGVNTAILDRMLRALASWDVVADAGDGRMRLTACGELLYSETD